MSRIGYIHQTVPINQDVTAFHAFLTANLTTWTVNPIQVYGTGSTQRDYFVLSHNTGSVEILIYMPLGVSSDLSNGTPDDSYFIPTTVTGGTDGCIALSVSLNGGFQSNLSSVDPALAGFWPSIFTEFVGLAPHFDTNTDAVNLYVIEDDSKEYFAIYCGKVSSNDGYSFWQYSETNTVFDRIPNDGNVNWLADGVIFMEGTFSTTNEPRDLVNYAHWFHRPGQTERSLYTTSSLFNDSYTALVNGNLPITPELGYFSSRAAGALNYGEDQPFPYRSFVGQLNPQDFRSYPNITETYRRKLYGQSGGIFVHIFSNVLTPWASNLPDPV